MNVSVEVDIGAFGSDAVFPNMALDGINIYYCSSIYSFSCFEHSPGVDFVAEVGLEDNRTLQDISSCIETPIGLESRSCFVSVQDWKFIVV